MSTKVSDGFGFYGILTAPLVGYEELTRILVDLGVPFVQLRMKKAPRDEVRRMAERLRQITAGSSSRLIINDDPDIAREVGADGVHLGQDDAPYAGARQLIGPQAVIGLSTHNPDQTAAACALAPDYIGIGPVYPTPTKELADPPIGVAGMQTMLARATVPAVVLGALDASNLRPVLEAGARNFASVRPVNRSEDPASVVRALQAIHRSVWG